MKLPLAPVLREGVVPGLWHLRVQYLAPDVGGKLAVLLLDLHRPVGGAAHGKHQQQYHKLIHNFPFC